MLPCSEVRTRLASGETPDSGLESHLAGCLECRGFKADLAVSLDSLRRLPIRPTPAGLQANVLRSIRQTAPGRLRAARARWAYGFAFAAAAIAAAVFGLRSAFPRTEIGSPQTPLASASAVHDHRSSRGGEPRRAPAEAPDSFASAPGGAVPPAHATALPVSPSGPMEISPPEPRRESVPSYAEAPREAPVSVGTAAAPQRIPRGVAGPDAPRNGGEVAAAGTRARSDSVPASPPGLRMTVANSRFTPATEGTCTVVVELGSETRLRISVLDRAGRVVRTLYAARSSRAQVRWDGASDAGLLCPSGVYQIVATCETGSARRPVLLQR